MGAGGERELGSGGWLGGWEEKIGPEIFQRGGADAFDALEVVDGFIRGVIGGIFLEALAVFDDSAGHGGAEVGEGGEIVFAGGVGVEFVEEVGGTGAFQGLGIADSRGGELVAD